MLAPVPTIAKDARTPCKRSGGKADARTVNHWNRVKQGGARVVIDRGVCCDKALIDEVLRSADEDIDRFDDPEVVTQRRRAGHAKPIYAGRLHSPVRVYNTVGVPHRDVVAFSRYNDDGSFAVYRYGTTCTAWRPVSTSDKVLAPYDMTTFDWIGDLVRIVHEKTGETPNHCIVTRYVDHGDSISAHRDKTLDIMPGTEIHAFSFGAPRTFRCVHMDISPTRWSETHRTVSGGLLSLPYAHNLDYKHAIMAGDGEQRVSVVLRSCRTRYDPASGASVRLAAAEHGPFANVRSAESVNFDKVG